MNVKKDLQLHHIACLELAVLTRGHVEGNSLALIERLEAVHLDLGKMNEKVFAILLGDEAVAFSGLNHLTVPSAILKSSSLPLKPGR